MSTDAPAGAARPASRIALSPRAVLIAETAAAAALAFIAIGARSFWLDESVSVTIAKLDWGSFVHQLRVREGNMSLYHLLLFAWIRIGDSEAFARSLSAIAAAATVPVGYVLARRLAGVRVAAVAGLLLAINPMLIRYAQEARGYELCLFLVIAGSYLFVRGIEEPSWKVWLAYAVVIALAAYAHDFALLVPPAHAVSLAFLDRREIPWRKLAGASALLCASLGLLLYLLASNDSSGIEWAGGNAPGRLFTRIHDHRPVAAAVLVAGALLIVASILALRRLGRGRLQTRTAWAWAFASSWLLVPLALVVVLAIVYRPLFVVRYFIVCLPPLVLLVSLAIDRIRPARAAALALVVLSAFSIAGVVRWYATGQDEDWRGATRAVLASGSPRDGVVFYAPYVRIPFTLYADRGAGLGRAPQPVFPAAGWNTEPIRFNSYVPVGADEVRKSAARFRGIWVVLSHVALFGRADPGYEAVRTGLAEAGFHEAASTRFDGVEVRRYERG